MMLCCTHTGYRTAREAIDASAGPIIFSHSNPRAIWDHPRNIPDELMRACADRGGVIGINGIGPFLGDNDVRAETFAAHRAWRLPVLALVSQDFRLDPESQRRRRRLRPAESLVQAAMHLHLTDLEERIRACKGVPWRAASSFKRGVRLRRVPCDDRDHRTRARY